MTTFGLIHGAFHGAWCWGPLEDQLRGLGHETVAMDLPCEDASAGNVRYAEVVADALGDRGPVTLVGHSLGGLTVPLVAAARPVERMVFLCAFIPRPGEPFSTQFGDAGIFPETPESTWPIVGEGRMTWPAERVIPALYPDCTPDVAAWAAARLREQTLTPHGEPCPLEAWPDVPSSYILARDDLAVGADWARRAARDRLGTTAEELPGGHSPFLSRPAALAEVLDRIARS
jgi:pimeloyl-ACP methyl ester carboxylesterase